MKNFTLSLFRKIKLALKRKPTHIDQISSYTSSTYSVKFEKESSLPPIEQTAEELFSAFTANIIKKETLFTR